MGPMGHGQKTKNPEPCTCNGDLYWQDGYGGFHCQACEPPPSTSLVVHRFLLAGGEWHVERRPGSGDFVAVEAGQGTVPPGRTSSLAASAAPTGRTRQQFCDDCFLHPDLWREVSSPKYHDRVRVECRVCGKWIGYRLISDSQTQGRP